MEPLSWSTVGPSSASPKASTPEGGRSNDAALERVAGELADLADPFSVWFAGAPAVAAARAEMSFADLERPLIVGLALMHRLSGASPVGWRPVQLAQALDKLTEDGDRVIGALLLYTRFLADTDRWRTGLPDLRMSLSLLEGELAPDTGELTSLTAAAEVEELSSTPAVRRIVDLVGWVGERRALTAGGNLKLADVAEASALLGHPVATSRAARVGDVPVVRTMAQAPVLSVTWVAAHRAGLLEAVGASVRATAAGDDLTSTDDDLRLQALRQACSACVLTLLEADVAEGEEADTDIVRLTALALGRGITADPLTLTTLHEVADATSENDLREDLASELALWQEAGLVEVAETIEVPGGRPPRHGGGPAGLGSGSGATAAPGPVVSARP